MDKTIESYVRIQQAVKELGIKEFLIPGACKLLETHKDDKRFIIAFYSGLQAAIDEKFDITPEDQAELINEALDELRKNGVKE